MCANERFPNGRSIHIYLSKIQWFRVGLRDDYPNLHHVNCGVTDRSTTSRNPSGLSIESKTVNLAYRRVPGFLDQCTDQCPRSAVDSDIASCPQARSYMKTDRYLPKTVSGSDSCLERSSFAIARCPLHDSTTRSQKKGRGVGNNQIVWGFRSQDIMG